MLVLLGVLVGAALWGASLAGRCQRITAPACRDVGYNATAMPNMMGHESQEEAAMQVSRRWAEGLITHSAIVIGCNL